MVSEITVCAAGDAIISRDVSHCDDPGFLRLKDKITGADVSFVNFETMVHDYEGYPADSGMPFRAPPSVLDELSWLGFDLFGVAMNHANDYWHRGMETTLREFRDRSLPFTGFGMNLSEASSPAYVDTPVGRVGLVAFCSTIPPDSDAAPQGRDVKGRPGIFGLRTETSYTVPASELEGIRSLTEKLGLDEELARRREYGIISDERDSDRSADLLNIGSPVFNSTIHFEEGDEYGIEIEPNEEDLSRVTDRIASANKQADIVLASFHTHKGQRGYVNHHTVPQFAKDVAHACVDAGADLFIGHGPHVMRGIEMYNGTPVLHSLGDFILQHEAMTRFPASVYQAHDVDEGQPPAELYSESDFGRVLGDPAHWRSYFPVCDFEDGTLAGFSVYPLELDWSDSWATRGIPRISGGEAGDRILQEVESLSEELGTDLTVEDGTGEIEI